jgi:hypothetical protein
MSFLSVSDRARSALRPSLRLCLISAVLLAGAAHPLWSQSAVWQPQGATTGNIYYNGGNVGIGTAGPAAKLTIADVSQAFNGETGSIKIINSADTTESLYLGYDNSLGSWGSAYLQPIKNGIAWLPMLINPNGGNVGIGSTAPAKRLEVNKGSAASDGILIRGVNDTRLTIGAGQPTYWSWATGWSQAGDFSLIEEGVSGDRIYVKPGGNVGIGTTNPQYKLAVNGTLGAKEVIVTNSGWSDYVFRPGYRLRPLSEVDQFIREHGHLPEIPSEAEVKEKGVNVMIQADERNSRLEQQNQEFRERIERLETAR